MRRACSVRHVCLQACIHVRLEQACSSSAQVMQWGCHAGGRQSPARLGSAKPTQHSLIMPGAAMSASQAQRAYAPLFVCEGFQKGVSHHPPIEGDKAVPGLRWGALRVPASRCSVACMHLCACACAMLRRFSLRASGKDIADQAGWHMCWVCALTRIRTSTKTTTTAVAMGGPKSYKHRARAPWVAASVLER
jgi:hypothetical protein